MRVPGTATPEGAQTVPSAAGRRLPLLQGMRPFDRRRLPSEVVAGLVLAAVGIPEVMGYTKIAGTPVVTGLYTLLLPALAFALLGSSRHLVVGADSATAAILAAGLVGLAKSGSSQYLAYAGLLAIVTGVLMLLARVVRLGFLADFLSRTVLTGFLTGVGIQVALRQVGGMLGVTPAGSDTVRRFVNVASRVGHTHRTTLLVSLAVIAVTVVASRIDRRIPGALIAVVGAIIASAAFDLAGTGVAVVGYVPRGLPTLTLPSLSLSVASKLVGTAFSLFLVILAQSAATSRAYAVKYSDPFDENVDLVGLGAANLLAGLSGTFVVNGSPTKTEIVDDAGGRSQLAMVVTAVTVVIVLLFLTGPLRFLPEAVLSAVVFMIGLRLVKWREMRGILRARRGEFAVACLTALTVVVVGVEQGIILAIVLSLAAHVSHSYRPNDALLVPQPAGHFLPMPVESWAQAAPGLMVYAFGASFYYANANRFGQRMIDLVTHADPPLRWLCIDAAMISDIDFTAAGALRATHDELGRRGITLVLAHVVDPVRRELEQYGLVDLLGSARIYDGVHEVVAAYQAEAGGAAQG